MNEHPYSQFFGSVLLLTFSGLLALLAFLQEHNAMRHGLYAAASWMAFVVLTRMLALAGLMSHVDARSVNGLVAGIFLAALVTVLYVNRLSEQRAR